MKAGRELDAKHIVNLVATEVMGWQENEGMVPLAWTTPDGQLRTYEETSFKSFNPWEDIAAAWEVVERVLATWTDDSCLPEFRVQRYKQPGWEAYFGAEYESYEPTFWHYWAEGNMAPEAICLAALKAKGVKA